MTCRYSSVPSHVCVEPVHLHLAGGLCATAAPPAQPAPPAGTTLTDLQAARRGGPHNPEAPMTGPDFGPQHDHVTALLARARALTPVEQQAIVARARAMAPDLRDAKHAAAVHMGWRDPHNAVATIRAAQTPGAPDPGGHALLFTGWRAGFHATAVPILCDVLAWTVLALTGRHILPGPAYEALTRCWAQVIGRAHPDDVRTLEDSMFPAGVAR